jgi:hypothetical protein
MFSAQLISSTWVEWTAEQTFKSGDLFRCQLMLSLIVPEKLPVHSGVLAAPKQIHHECTNSGQRKQNGEDIQCPFSDSRAVYSQEVVKENDTELWEVHADVIKNGRRESNLRNANQRDFYQIFEKLNYLGNGGRTVHGSILLVGTFQSSHTKQCDVADFKPGEDKPRDCKPDVGHNQVSVGLSPREKKACRYQSVR